MRIGAKQLERNQPVELIIMGLVHRAHAAGAKRLQDSVVGDPRSLGDSFHNRAASPDKAGKKDRMPDPYDTLPIVVHSRRIPEAPALPCKSNFIAANFGPRFRAEKAD